MSATFGGIRLSGSDPVGSLEVALNHAARLLTTQPALAAEQRNDEACAEASFNCRIAQCIAGPIENVRQLQWLALGDCLAKTRLRRGNVELAETSYNVVIEP